VDYEERLVEQLNESLLLFGGVPARRHGYRTISQIGINGQRNPREGRRSFLAIRRRTVFWHTPPRTWAVSSIVYARRGGSTTVLLSRLRVAATVSDSAPTGLK